MATSEKTTKSASRWGFLSQAVASVESRLDTMLAEEDEQQKSSTLPLQPRKDNASPVRGSSDLSRSECANRTNDRLQQRLAQAMVKKGASRVQSPAPISEPVSLTATPGSESKTSFEQPASSHGPSVRGNAPMLQDSDALSLQLLGSPNDTASQEEDGRVAQGVETEPAAQPEPPGFVEALLTNQTKVPRSSTDNARAVAAEISAPRASLDFEHGTDKPLTEQDIQQIKSQDDIGIYIERIDALTSKLQYLASEAAESARTSVTTAGSSTLEKKLAEKDQKIALLIEEGTKLSKKEMKFLTTIKMLKTQVVASTKDQETTRQRAEKAERSLAKSEDKLTKTEIANRRAEERVSGLTVATIDLEAITKERNALSATLAEVRSQLNRANQRAEDAESRADSSRIDAEKKRNTELQDNLASLKVEHKLAEEKFRREISDLKGIVEREKEQTRTMETEMLAEQAALEGKLESFRVRAEEASSGDQGDVQAKLLRQIETLQSQYSAASQNWQGIEGTLLARITLVEKERDEVVQRENDVRRKLRDATLKARNARTEADDIRDKLNASDDSLASKDADIQRLTQVNQKLEQELKIASKEADDHKNRSDREFSRRFEEEKLKWLSSAQISAPGSLGNTNRKSAGYDTMHLISPARSDRAFSRRSSVQPPTYQSNAMSRQDSMVSVRAPANGGVPETPPIAISGEPDDFFADMPPTPASGTHAGSGIAINDVISASTIGAGPSVQLVERMSANVRRLESEKAASKDEIARLSAQRDESRQEVVNLMREVEQHRTTVGRLQTMETEHKTLNQKYQTMLELLGEKTEQVEELQADILDVKQMYRHLADTMGKV